MSGFIYILSNPSFPSLLKIGKTERVPSESRVSELYTTGVPSPFKVEYYALVDDHDRLERVIHSRLDSLRHNSGREFFKVDVEEVVRLIRQNDSLLYERKFYKTAQDKKLEAEMQESERARRRAEEARQQLDKMQREQQEQDRVNNEKIEAERWERSIVFARELVEKERVRFKQHYAKTQTWKVYWLVVSLASLPMLHASSSAFAVMIAAMAGGFAIPFWLIAKRAKEDQARELYSDAVVQDVANMHFRGGDCHGFIQLKLENALRLVKQR
jgi:hypothetical protein